jgi:hypothetical protein
MQTLFEEREKEIFGEKRGGGGGVATSIKFVPRVRTIGCCVMFSVSVRTSNPATYCNTPEREGYLFFKNNYSCE